MSIRRISKTIIFGLFLTISFSTPYVATAKVMAHVVDGNGFVLTIDTDTDTVVAKTILPNLLQFVGETGHIVASPADNLLFVVDAKRPPFRVKIFELKSLSFRKDIGVAFRESPEILTPPNMPHFFVKWVDATGTEVVTRYDKASLTRLEDLSSVAPLGDQTFISSDGTRLYSYRLDTQDSVSVVETKALQLLSNVALPPLFASGIWGGGIEDIRDHVALLAENAKVQHLDADRLTLFTLRLTDGTRSTKIATGLQGDARLTPTADKVLLHETMTIRGLGGEHQGYRSSGRIHVYDVATGAKLGQVTIPLNGSNGSLEAIHPQGNKAYFFSGQRDGSRKLTSFSLTSFSTLKEIPLQEVVVLIAFFDQ